MATEKEEPERPAGLALLRQPFPAHQISKLPKPTKKQTDEVRNDYKKGIRCKECGAWHHPDVVHLDYVGHAALTDRLLDADPNWDWEPLARDQRGLPAFDQDGCLWIKLTVCGVTRIGVGDADGKIGGNARKEAIGDALRNAAMRFGAALDLWHKGDLHIADDTASEAPKEARQYAFPPGPAKNITDLKTKLRPVWREVAGCGDDSELDGIEASYADLIMQTSSLEDPSHRQLWEGDGKDNPGLKGLIESRRAEFAQAPNILAAG